MYADTHEWCRRRADEAGDKIRQVMQDAGVSSHRIDKCVDYLNTTYLADSDSSYRRRCVSIISVDVSASVPRCCLWVCCFCVYMS